MFHKQWVFIFFIKRKIHINLYKSMLFNRQMAYGWRKTSHIIFVVVWDVFLLKKNIERERITTENCFSYLTHTNSLQNKAESEQNFSPHDIWIMSANIRLHFWFTGIYNAVHSYIQCSIWLFLNTHIVTSYFV